LGIITDEAEKLKKEYGYATEEAIIRDEDIYIKRVGARGDVKIPLTLLTQIIGARMRELFTLIDKDLRNTGYKQKLKAGVVLTGGGSLLRGTTELAEEILGLPSRIGVPLQLGRGLSSEIESPEFATVAGLIKGIPGTFTTDQLSSGRVKKSSKKISLNQLFKKIHEFFDEL
jgi:cell division protein FtsA